MSEIAYHGTPHIETVLHEGLRGDKASCFPACSPGCIWLARNPEDAAAFGQVVEVDTSHIPGGFEEDAWQGHYNGGDIGPDRLKRAEGV